MDVRNSFSRLKKKVKRMGGKRKPGRTGADTDGESISAASSLPQPEPHVVAGDGGGGGSDPDGRQASSTDQPLQPDEPESVPASGGENDGVGDADVDGGQVGTVYSHPHPGIESGTRSGPNRGGDGADEEGDEIFYSCSSTTPSAPRSGEPDGM